MSSEQIVIGIDGGGTHTRVLAAKLSGEILSYVEGGAASVKKDESASLNVQAAIVQAVKQAGCELSQISVLATGIAGFDDEADRGWVEALTDLPGLTCRRLHVNDAVIAHAGAFANGPGIIAISGTGSIVFGITERGRHVRNYDFGHYAASAARFLAYQAVFEIIAGSGTALDTEWIRRVLKYWNVGSIAELGALGAKGFMQDRMERNRIFGEMAPLVTEAAHAGCPLAAAVCERAVHELIVGIGLIASCFGIGSIPVALTGSVADSPFFRSMLQRELSARSYDVREAVLPAAGGAVLMALEQSGVPVDGTVFQSLFKQMKCRGVR